MPSRRTLTTMIVSVTSLALPTSGAADQAHGAPTVRVLASPLLITVKGDVPLDRPTTYVFFRLSRHLHEPRLVLAKVKGRIGRTYAVRGSRVRNCYKSVLLLRGSRTRRPVAGRSYRVSFIARSSPHQSSAGKTPFAAFTVKAHARPLVGASVRADCPR